MVVPQNWAHKDLAHEVHLFGQCLQIAFFFPEFSFVPGASQVFLVCPAEAFNLVCCLPQNRLLIHNLGPFFLSESQLLLEYLLFDLALGFLSPSACRHRQRQP